VALCYREGASHYLQKPLSLESLKHLLGILARCFGSDPPSCDLLLTLPEYRPPPSPPRRARAARD
jgi:hypothetical protein